MSDERIKIVVSADETKLAAEAGTALAKRGDIYQRANMLVEPHLDAARKLPGLLRPYDELKLLPVRKARMRALLAEAARFVKTNKTEHDKEDEVNVPEFLPPAILSQPDWPGIPVIESVAENPTLRKDGTIHDTPGYDPYTGNYFSSDGVVFPPIPPNPTREEARAAFDVLMEPFCDFPFVDAPDKSVVAAAILTMLGRPAIPGPTPPFVIRTPTPRTGKDLCTDAMTTIGTGRPTPGRSLPVKDDAELKKLFLSLGLSGVRVVSFGNCEGGIGSPVLSHSVTREMISDRLLGSNSDVSVPLRPVWLFNGNNPYYVGDFGPRVIQCSMDAGIENPQSRKDWKHDPLLPYVQQERPKLVVAGLTILRAFCANGRPSHGKSKKGSFEGWDDLIRGALVWIGVTDPCAADKEIRIEGDADLEQLGALLSSWRAMFGNEAVTLRAAVEASQNSSYTPKPNEKLDINARLNAPDNKPSNGANGHTNGVNGHAHQNETRRDLAAAFMALEPRLGDRYSAATLRHRIRHHKGRPVDVVGDGKPENVLSLEISSKRSGPSKVTAWCVLNTAERDGVRKQAIEDTLQEAREQAQKGVKDEVIVLPPTPPDDFDWLPPVPPDLV